MLVVGCTPSTASSLTISNNTNLYADSLRLGAVDGRANGAVTVQDGGTLIVRGDALIGENGDGTVTQAGGGSSCVVNGAMQLGLYPGSTGTYTLQGGTLTSPYVSLGTEGNGVLRLQGGTITGVRRMTIRSNLCANGALEGYGVVGR